MQKKFKYFIIQGNYGQGWEDESFYSMGERQKNRSQAHKEAKKDLIEYNIASGYSHRIIERYETEEE